MNTETVAQGMTMVAVLFEKCGENITTVADPRAAWEGQVDLLTKRSFCAGWDNDMQVEGLSYEVHEVTLPTWLSVEEWLGSTTKWHFAWGSGINPEWCETWQRKLAELPLHHRNVLCKLLSANLRSEFRISLRDQVAAWLNSESTFKSPLSARQMEVLMAYENGFDAKRLEQGLYESARRSVNLGCKEHLIPAKPVKVKKSKAVKAV